LARLAAKSHWTQHVVDYERLRSRHASNTDFNLRVCDRAQENYRGNPDCQPQGSHWLPRPQESNGAFVSLALMKHQLFMIVVVIAVVVSTMGWFYALGWLSFKLIQFI
jgi:hypothetical protein